MTRSSPRCTAGCWNSTQRTSCTAATGSMTASSCCPMHWSWRRWTSTSSAVHTRACLSPRPPICRTWPRSCRSLTRDRVMGILQRLSLLIRSNINDAISRGENPEKVLNQVIADMREQLARAKQEVAVAIADERKLRAQVDEERKQAADWENRAILAICEGRDDLAKQALIRQQEHAERAAALEETWRRQADETEKLKVALRELNDRIEEAKRKKNLLIAKQKRAQAQKRIHETMAGLS